jgi:hypothetical protein
MKLLIVQFSPTTCNLSWKSAFGYSDVKHLEQFPIQLRLSLASTIRGQVRENIDIQYKVVIWKIDVIDTGTLCISLIFSLLCIATLVLTKSGLGAVQHERHSATSPVGTCHRVAVQSVTYANCSGQRWAVQTRRSLVCRTKRLPLFSRNRRSFRPPLE